MSEMKQWIWIAASLLTSIFAGCLQNGGDDVPARAGEDVSQNLLPSIDDVVETNHGIWLGDGYAAVGASAMVGASCTHMGDGVYSTSAWAVGQSNGSSANADASYSAQAEADAGSVQNSATNEGSWPSKNAAHAATVELKGRAPEGFVVKARGFAEAFSPVLGTVSTEKVATATCGGSVEEDCDAIADPKVRGTSETDSSGPCTASIQAVQLGD